MLKLSNILAVIVIALIVALLLGGCSGLRVEWDARATYRPEETLDQARQVQDAAISRAQSDRFVDGALRGLRP